MTDKVKVKLVQSQYGNCRGCYYNRHLNGCAASDDEIEVCIQASDVGENAVYVEDTDK